jgi:hypothetical protein
MCNYVRLVQKFVHLSTYLNKVSYLTLSHSPLDDKTVRKQGQPGVKPHIVL